MFAAQITQVAGVEVTTLIAVASALGVLFGLWKKMNSVEEDIARKVKTLLMAGQAETDADAKRGANPQPFIVQMAKEFTSRDSFHKHAELNRQHHEKIEARVTALERKLESDKEEIIAAGEDRAMKIHDRINVAIEKIGELRGEVTQMGRGAQR